MSDKERIKKEVSERAKKYNLEKYAKSWDSETITFTWKAFFELNDRVVIEAREEAVREYKKKHEPKDRGRYTWDGELILCRK